jgi:hypothetical protein
VRRKQKEPNAHPPAALTFPRQAGSPFPCPRCRAHPRICTNATSTSGGGTVQRGCGAPGDTASGVAGGFTISVTPLRLNGENFSCDTPPPTMATPTPPAPAAAAAGAGAAASPDHTSLGALPGAQHALQDAIRCSTYWSAIMQASVCPGRSPATAEVGGCGRVRRCARRTSHTPAPRCDSGRGAHHTLARTTRRGGWGAHSAARGPHSAAKGLHCAHTDVQAPLQPRQRLRPALGRAPTVRPTQCCVRVGRVGWG